MMRASIVLCVFSLALPASSPGWASGGRYLTWVDDNGGVHNTFVDGQFDRQQRQARQRIGQSDQARVLNKADNATQWPGNSSGGESKRRYYTWIDANGNVQNSFYAGAKVAGQRADYVLPNGEHSAEYIDAEAFEGKGFVRSENGSPYYTWVDEKGRMHNSQIPPEERAARFKREAAPSSQIAFTEGRQIEFKQRPAALPGLDGAGQQSDALKALLKGTEMTIDDLYQDLQRRCCEQIAESDFTELDADEPRYEELNRFSPSFDFPMGRSFYAAIPAAALPGGLRPAHPQFRQPPGGLPVAAVPRRAQAADPAGQRRGVQAEPGNLVSLRFHRGYGAGAGQSRRALRAAADHRRGPLAANPRQQAVQASATGPGGERGGYAGA